MPITVTSHTIHISLPSDAKVGEEVPVQVTFTANCHNDNHHNSEKVSMTASFTDNQGLLSGAGRDEKWVGYGSVHLNVTVDARAIYQSPGWVNVISNLKIYTGSSVPIHDSSSDKGFNVRSIS